DRFSRDLYYDANPDAYGKTYSWLGATCEPSTFDARSLGLPEPIDATLEPMHRIGLETATAAFASAGLSPEKIRGLPIPVILGFVRGSSRCEDYALRDEIGRLLAHLDSLEAAPLSPDELGEVRS